MGINKVKPSFETRQRHVKRGERRVADMECHVQNLRKKLCRLEKMLPRDDLAEQPKLDCCVQDKTDEKRGSKIYLF